MRQRRKSLSLHFLFHSSQDSIIERSSPSSLWNPISTAIRSEFNEAISIDSLLLFPIYYLVQIEHILLNKWTFYFKTLSYLSLIPSQKYSFEFYTWKADPLDTINVITYVARRNQVFFLERQQPMFMRTTERKVSILCIEPNYFKE